MRVGSVDKVGGGGESEREEEEEETMREWINMGGTDCQPVVVVEEEEGEERREGVRGRG